MTSCNEQESIMEEGDIYKNDNICIICLEENLENYKCHICNCNTCSNCTQKYINKYKKRECPHCRGSIHSKLIIKYNNESIRGILNTNIGLNNNIIQNRFKIIILLFILSQLFIPSYFLGKFLINKNNIYIKNNHLEFLLQIILGYSFINVSLIFSSYPLLIISPNFMKKIQKFFCIDTLSNRFNDNANFILIILITNCLTVFIFIWYLILLHCIFKK